jgi:hypothetical protein
VESFPFGEGGDIGATGGHQLRREEESARKSVSLGNEWREGVGLR